MARPASPGSHLRMTVPGFLPSAISLDHLVGEREQRVRNGEAERRAVSFGAPSGNLARLDTIAR
jgi:hypothetical protein